MSKRSKEQRAALRLRRQRKREHERAKQSDGEQLVAAGRSHLPVMMMSAGFGRGGPDADWRCKQCGGSNYDEVIYDDRDVAECLDCGAESDLPQANTE